jgi:hypothetical protein
VVIHCRENNVANRDWSSAGKLYSMHVSPVMIDFSFIVDSTNPDGISNLKGPGVKNVYMHTSVTPSPGNPNPGTANIVVQLADSYHSFLAVMGTAALVNDGIDLFIDAGSLTPGESYVITTLGDATRDQWTSVGVPPGVKPAVGVAFIALNTGPGPALSTSRVQAEDVNSSVIILQQAGDPNAAVSPSPSANQGYGASFIFKAIKFGGAAVDGTRITIVLLLNNSAVQ